MSLINHPFHHPKPKGSFIFGTEDYVRKGGHEDRYDELLSQNKLLFTLYLIKESLTLAYSRKDETQMAEDIIAIMDSCEATGNNG